MINLGVIGYGYWGPNVVRNASAHASLRVVSVCDQNPEALRRAKQAYPEIEVTSDPANILRSPHIDAVAIVTPVWTHYELAKAALLNGKHVFVEKPFTSTSSQAEDLIALADAKQRVIMVDHTFLFTGAVQKIRELVDAGTLGNLYYYDSLRVNLGLFQHDVNVIWDLAPHDLSIMEHVINDEPEAVLATGERHINGHEDVAFITVYFPRRVIGHVNVNWLSPVKVRTTLIGGQKKMLVWNDLEPDEKIKVYDRGVIVNAPNGVQNLLVSYRSGDMWAPKIEQTEALRKEFSCFYDAIVHGTPIVNDGVAGWRVVRVIEAASRSMSMKGEAVLLDRTGTLAKKKETVVYREIIEIGGVAA
jgi:predicted dehydrogenase